MRVSIIMPVYNVEDYIEKSILSIKKQEEKEWELIIIDDGSVDDTFKKAKEIAKNDSRIQLIRQKNKGVSIARNKGLKIARGDFIAFLDGDDLWKEKFLIKMIKKILEKKDVVFCRYDRLLDNNIYPVAASHPKNDMAFLYVAQNKFPIHIGGCLIRRELLIKYNISFAKKISFGEDVEFLYKCMSVGRIGIVFENLMIYRKRKGSATVSPKNVLKNTMMAILVNRRITKYVINNRPLYYNEILSSVNKQLDYSQANYIYTLCKCGKLKEGFKYINRWKKSLVNTIRLRKLSKSKRMKFIIILVVSLIFTAVLKLKNIFKLK